MPNGTLTVLARVHPARRGALRELLDALERESIPVIPDVPGLHFARMALLDCAAQGSAAGESYLLLATDFVADCRRRELDARFVDALLDRLESDGAAARLFEHLFQQCQGFPGLADRKAARAFLLARRRPYSARHVAFPYRWQTPESIHEAVRARQALERLLDESSGEPPALAQLRAQVSPGSGHGHLRPRLASARRGAALATLSPSNALLTWKATRQARAHQRRLREGPPTQGFPWDEPPRFDRRRIAPDDQVQNPLTHLVPLDVRWPGAWRLRISLFLVNIRLRRYLVGLNRIQGIHFARWVLFKSAGRRHLLFLSCFDGTWDGYIGAFFHDLPVRALLEQLWRGARRFAEVRTLDNFKAWILARQIPTPIFYSAHRAPRLGVADIHQALQVQELLDGTRPEEELASYLRSGTCGPEVAQMTVRAALIEIARAFRGWLKPLRREGRGHASRAAAPDASAPAVHPRAIHRPARRYPAHGHPRAQEGRGLSVPADRAGRDREPEIVAEG